MKTFLLLTIGLGLAAAIISEPSYRPNTAYIYDYDVQVLSGFPETSQTTAGLVLNTKVKFITKENPEDIIVKLENVQLWHLMKELPRRPTVETYLPIEDFVPMEAEKFIAMERELTKPFVAKRERGLIMMVKVAADAPEWAVNMKKALLNTINLDMEKTTTSQASFRREPIKSEVFETKETTLFGECEPMYRVAPEAYGAAPEAWSAAQTMTVTKVIDLLKCKHRPVHLYSILEPRVCEECPRTLLDVITNRVEYKYELEGERHDFVIKKAEMTAMHVLLNTGNVEKPEHGTMAQFIRAKLSLLREEHAPTVHVPELKVCPEVLKMIMEDFNEEKPVLMERRFRTSLITELAQKIKEMINTPMAKRPEMILEMMPIMREASVEDLKMLIERLIPTPSSINELTDEHKMLKQIVIIDMLPYLRTRESVFVLKSLIATLGSPECILTECEVAETLAMLSLGVQASKYAVEEIHEIAKLVPVSTNPLTKKAAWLAYANTLKRLFLGLPNDRVLGNIPPIMKDTTFITKHISIISERWSLARTEEEKLLAVKIMSIIPLPELIPKIVTIVKDANLPMILRVEAIKAMELQAIIRPEKVIETCLPMLMNKELPEEVRIFAFRAIMMANPGSTILHHVANFINEEPNKHITSYCYSYLVTISRVTMPCFMKLGRTVRNVLKTIKPVAYGMKYSKSAAIPLFSEALQEGLLVETGMITTPKSFMPKTFHTKTDMYMFGRYMNLFEVTAFTEGVPALIEKMVGSAGSWRNSDSVFDMVRRRVPRSADRIASKRAAINRMMSEWRNAPEEPKIAIFTKLLGREMPFFEINKEFLRNVKTDGRFHIADIDSYLRNGIPLNIHKNVIMENIERVIPTLVGIPLKVKFQIAASVKVDGTAKLIIEPNLFRSERNREVPSEVTVEVNAVPKVATFTKFAVDLELPVLKIGTKAIIVTDADTPLDMKVKVEPKEMKFDVEIKPIAANKDVMKVVMGPEAVIEALPEPVYMMTEMPERREFKVIMACKTVPELVRPEVYEIKANACPITTLLFNAETVLKYQRPTVPVFINGPLPPYTPWEMVLKTRPESRIEKITAKAEYEYVEAGSAAADWPMIHKLPRAIPYKKIELVIGKAGMGTEKEVLMTKIYSGFDEEEWMADFHMMSKGEEGKEYEFCMSAESKAPKVPEFYTRPLPRSAVSWPLKMEANFGKCHQGTPAIAMTITALKSEEQVQLEASHTSWPEYRSCMAVPERARRQHPSCNKLMDVLAAAKEFHIVIDADRTQIPAELLSYLRRCPILTKCPLLKMSWDPSRPAVQHIALDMTMLQLNGIPTESHEQYSHLAKLRLNVPGLAEPVEWIRRLPISLPAVSVKKPILAVIADHLTANKHAICTVHQEEIVTFDGKSIKPIEEGKEILLTKDISSREEFAVTLKKVAGGRQILKVIIGRGKEVVLVKPSVQAAPAVYVDGREQSANTPVITIPVPEMEAKIVIEQPGGAFKHVVTVKVENHGVPIQVQFSGPMVVIKASPLKFGKVSGLCGNYDGLAENDKRKPDMSLAISYPDLIRSYALPRSEVSEHEEPEEADRPRASIFNW